MNPYNLAVLFFSFCCLLIGLLIFLKRQDAVGRTYLFFSIFSSVWGIGFSILLNQDVSYEQALLATRISNMSAVFIPVCWLHSILCFTGQKTKHVNLLWVLYVVSLFIDLFGLSSLFVNRLEPIPGFKYYGRPGILYYLFTALFFGIVSFGFSLLIRKFRDTRGDKRKRFFGFILANAFGFGGGCLTFFPIYEKMIPQWGLFFMPLYPFLMAYTLIRQKLFDDQEIADAVQKDKLAALGTISTSLSHEIRNPLYVIRELGQGHLLNMKEGVYGSKEEITQRTREILEKTNKQVERAMDIMSRFSAFAKAKSDETVQAEDVDLNTLIDEIMPLLQHELTLENIEVKREIPSSASKVRAEKCSLEQIFFNLILNSYQAMEKGGKIEISAEQHNGSVNVTLRDNGPGIPEKVRSQIFEPFYTTKEKGTGLGLYITKQLVERNGGKIRVDSKPGRGTIFRMEFSTK